MSSAKRKITKIVAIVIGIFTVLNLFWFGWRQIRHSSFSFIDGMEQTELSTLLVPLAKITAHSSPYAVPNKLGFRDTDVERVVNGLRFTPMERMTM